MDKKFQGRGILQFYDRKQYQKDPKIEELLKSIKESDRKSFVNTRNKINKK
jgi:hypothetical protein